mmetsp:Transcript_22918/g.33497  ORF Transcript_22918/g.33497 Transcript_22918/m.33497 type:complete len:1092 (+) Transcript_22918:179-3454(+)|eukprot:CAMPEP_0185027860 /NCGR_PEP_ID=MMETSP1103-20130426/13124_1 /TAXON_ID=36769 /ORGANISM="Paraphysomonas bandaiensis, Strain Caron Lab Isolate" /LENGTH=1091 /DNA_ID=CAMNT_0027562015 /DNA_START=107 /DNA_END=3382 /DNA_ORIENTATION=+
MNTSEADRKALLLSLKDCARKLTPYVHEATEGYHFNERNNHVSDLVTSLEKCLFHGINTVEFCGTLPFWGMLERLETVNPPIHAVRNTVGAVACMNALRTPASKARAWIRQALNTNCLDATVVAITSHHKKLLSFFYFESALLRHEPSVSILLAILRSLKVLKFNLSVDIPDLNVCPTWLQSRLEMSQSVKRGENIRNQTNLLPLDSFFSSFEKGMDLVISRVDMVASQAVKYLNESMDQPQCQAHSNFTQGNSTSREYVTAGSCTDRIPFFGTPLEILVQNEWRCSHACLEKRIGVPNQLNHLVSALTDAITTPGLFRHPAIASEVHSLRCSLEDEKGIPSGISVHTVAHCFLQWMYELPEPLLGFDNYQAVQACQEIEDQEHRIRNLSLLVRQAPWWSQATLLLVMNLLHRLTRPEITSCNGLNIVAVSVFATPFLLRSWDIGPIHGPGMSLESTDKAHMVAVAAGGSTVEVLITHQPSVCAQLQQYQVELSTALAIKCDRLRALQTEAVRFIVQSDMGSETCPLAHEDDDEFLVSAVFNNSCDSSDFTVTRERVTYDSMFRLWRGLQRTHCRMKDTASGSPGSVMLVRSRSITEEDLKLLDDVQDERIDDEGKSEWNDILPASPKRLANLMKSERWDVVFPVENALREFNSNPAGLLAIDCLTYFLGRFGDKAALLVCEFATRRTHICSLPIVCVYLVQICLVGLKLVSSQVFTDIISCPVKAANVQHIPLSQVARQPEWVILSDENCLNELFCLALFTLDDLMKHASPSRGVRPCMSSSDTLLAVAGQDILATCMTGCRVLIDELLHINRATSTEQLWRLWSEQRLQRQQMVVEAQFQRKKTRVQQSSNSQRIDSTPVREPHHEEIIKGADTVMPCTQPSSCTKYDVKSKIIGDTSEVILSDSEIALLENALPIEMQGCVWELRYSLLRDGASVETLVKRSKGSSRTILLIEDTAGALFGGIVCDDPWRFEGEKYYGRGTCRVFRFSGRHQGEKETISTYVATLDNDYFMLTSVDSIGMGGGGGGFAFLLDGDLRFGTSNSECCTFSSPCLASSTEFECARCNLFSVGDMQNCNEVYIRPELRIGVE